LGARVRVFLVRVFPCAGLEAATTHTG
jgi:hypothetical protein